MKRLWADANVLLRFLTGDPPELAERSARLMLQVERGEIVLKIPLLVVAEVIWVLKSFYRHSLADISRAVVPLLASDGLEVEERELVIQAIELAMRVDSERPHGLTPGLAGDVAASGAG